MRRTFSLGIASVLLASTSLLAAQASSQDTASVIALAERAVAESDRATAEAENALARAKQASISAHVALAEARRVAGLAPAVIAAPARASAPAAQASEAPIDENMAVGQTDTQVATSTTDRASVRQAIGASVANGPNEGALKSSPTPDFQLLASDKDKVASLAWTLDVSRPSASGYLSADQLTLSASGKLDDSGDASILGFDGPANGTELKVTFIHYGSKIHLDGRKKDQESVAEQRCLETPGTKPSECVAVKYPKGVSAFVEKYYPEGLKPLLDTVLPGNVWFLGANFSGNQARYKYLDRPSFSVKKEDHFGFGGGIFGGLLLGRGQTSITGSFDYKRAYEASDAVTLCQLVAGTAQTQCLTQPDGAPERSSNAIFGLEFRHAFPVNVGDFASIAVAPKVSVDVANDAYQVAFPVYFAHGADGKLRGGLRGLYVNEKDPSGGRKDDFTLGLFVGVPFSAFSQ